MTKSEKLIKLIESSKDAENLIRNSHEIHWSRKPSVDEDIHEIDFKILPKNLADAINKLDINMFDDREQIFAGEIELPMISIAKTNNNHYYLINTEGYEYPRYIVELKNFK